MSASTMRCRALETLPPGPYPPAEAEEAHQGAPAAQGGGRRQAGTLCGRHRRLGRCGGARRQPGVCFCEVSTGRMLPLQALLCPAPACHVLSAGQASVATPPHCSAPPPLPCRRHRWVIRGRGGRPQRQPRQRARGHGSIAGRRSWRRRCRRAARCRGCSSGARHGARLCCLLAAAGRCLQSRPVSGGGWTGVRARAPHGRLCALLPARVFTTACSASEKSVLTPVARRRARSPSLMLPYV